MCGRCTHEEVTYAVYMDGKRMDSFGTDYDSAIDYSIELSERNPSAEVEIKRRRQGVLG